MIQKNFAWTFAIGDRTTVRYVQEQFIPRLKADLEELRRLKGLCEAQAGALNLDPVVHEKERQLEAARQRLQLALQS